MTDEELADIVRSAYQDGERNLAPHDDPWLDVARAARAALCPVVAPLGPGETVTIPLPYIPAVFGEIGLSVTVDDEGTPLLRTHFAALGPDHVLILDAAGVDRLIEVCRRWQAAQDGDA